MTTGGSPVHCLELAIEAERFCRVGDWGRGIQCFRLALQTGTDDVRCLSAIYCQLGNAYFYREEYEHALEYHRWDLTLARRVGDIPREGQASGNLGNTLKMLGMFDESVMCFNRQLDIAKQLDDRRMQARALYNLGNVFHAKGKQLASKSGQADPGEIPVEAASAQRKAVEYYNDSLLLVRELDDRPAEGRIFGNLGNTYYLLGNFSLAIECHRKRLEFANEFGDVPAQRRAHSNLGNAFVFLADFASAAEHYRNALRLSQKLHDVALEAQACYSLGNTFTLLREPTRAVVYHLRHLIIARKMSDRVGEGRAHWSLANAYSALEQYPLALRCSKRHLLIARELHDDIGCDTAQLMIREIGMLMRNPPNSSPAVGQSAKQIESAHDPLIARLPKQSDHSENELNGDGGADDEEDDDDDLDAELEQQLILLNVDVLEGVENFTRAEDGTATTHCLSCLDVPEQNSQVNSSHTAAQLKDSTASSAPNFNRRLLICQGIDSTATTTTTAGIDLEDQFESIAHAGATNSSNHLSGSSSAAVAATEEEQAEDLQEQFYSLLLNSQSRRMDEQRCVLIRCPVSSSTDSAIPASIPQQQHQPSGARTETAGGDQILLDEAFLDLLEGMQGDRMDDQRANLPAFPGLRAGPGLQLFEGNVGSNTALMRTNGSGASDGLPEPYTSIDPSLDDEFLEMIFRLQTVTRINDQRSNLPDPMCRPPDAPVRIPPEAIYITEDADRQSSGLTENSSVNRSNHLQPARNGGSTSHFITSTSPTVPDEDFLALIQRIQCTRLDEQRCAPPSLSRPSEQQNGQRTNLNQVDHSFYH